MFEVSGKILSVERLYYIFARKTRDFATPPMC